MQKICLSPFFPRRPLSPPSLFSVFHEKRQDFAFLEKSLLENTLAPASRAGLKVHSQPQRRPEVTMSFASAPGNHCPSHPCPGAQASTPNPTQLREEDLV